MRSAMPELKEKIDRACLALLLEKEPELVGMREIAEAAGITATTIYRHYPDKESLFEAVKLERIAAMDAFIAGKTQGIARPLARMRAILEAFRDWAFENPRVALLVMGRLKAANEASPQELERYYRSMALGKAALDEAIAQGDARSDDSLLDAAAAVAALWGGIESILCYRTAPELWPRGKDLTDRIIDIFCAAVSAEQRS
jgi:AcrR family transcriptional regulator